jgi:hypothetical protein
MPRSDHPGWRRQQPERYVAGRRPDTPENREIARLAHEAESEAHQANSGDGPDWLTVLTRTDPERAKKLQQTTNDRPPLQTVKE